MSDRFHPDSSLSGSATVVQTSNPILSTSSGAIQSELKTARKHTLPCGRPLPYEKLGRRQVELLLGEMKQRLEKFVQQKKIKRSETREKILKTIIYDVHHFRAQDLCEHLTRRYPEVGKATVYRSLPVFVESGILQEGLTGDDGQVFYELAEEEHHDHIVCLDCQRIFEFQDDTIEQSQDRLTSDLKFSPQKHRHVIYASCEYLKEYRVRKLFPESKDS